MTRIRIATDGLSVGYEIVVGQATDCLRHRGLLLAEVVELVVGRSQRRLPSWSAWVMRNVRLD